MQGGPLGLFERARKCVRTIPAADDSSGSAFVALSDWGSRGKVQKGTAFIAVASEAILRGTTVMIRAVAVRFLERLQACCQRR
jgi:hypothetical protein